MTLRAHSFDVDFEGPAAGVWSAVADTARFNEAVGVARQSVTETIGDNGAIVFHARSKVGPFNVAWEDIPCNWVKERWFEHTRNFIGGPFRRMVATFRLAPRDVGCRGSYTLAVEPRNVLGTVAVAAGGLATFEKNFRRLARDADAFAQGQHETAFTIPPPKLTPAARERAARLEQELAATNWAHGLAARLVNFILTAPDNDAQKIRPLQLARLWQVPARHVVEACLQATRLGLLTLRWDLLCPRCRVAKSVSVGLDSVPTGAHCGSCNIDYGRDFSKNVELSFRPAEQIRPIEGGEFCLFGPMSTPHIWAHITLEAGASRDLGETVPPGPYRLRTLEAGPETDFAYDGGPFPTVEVTPDGVNALPGTDPACVRLVNATPWRRTIVIEERAQVADALTADRVTALQAFRDLFSDEVLRPGDEVGIQRVALLFSDLRGSTALYGAIGDASAYARVRDHFAWLAGIVREHDGCIVKTIGDAVMAAFHEPGRALDAALAMQRGLADFNRSGGRPLTLKLGLHEGPCIAVTLNDRLDYFGSTVNLAARLQGESRGGDIVVSTEMANDPALADRLAELGAVAEEARLKGFDDPVGFRRVRVTA